MDTIFAAITSRDVPALLAAVASYPVEFSSAILQAASFGWVEGVVGLCRARDSLTPADLAPALLRAADADAAAVIGALVARDASPSEGGPLQRTALHVALGAGAMQSVVVLLDNLADVSVRDDVGRTPADLALAAMKNEPSEAELGASTAFRGAGGAAALPLLASACVAAAARIDATGAEVPPSLRDLPDAVAEKSWAPDTLAAAQGILKAARAAAARGRALALGHDPVDDPDASSEAHADASLPDSGQSAKLRGRTAAGASIAGGSSRSVSISSPQTGAGGRLYPWSNAARRAAAAAALARRSSASRSRSAEDGDDGAGVAEDDGLVDHHDDDAISGIMDVDVLLALVVTKFQASVAQGLVASYADIYTALDSLGDDGCSAGDVASGCAAMGVIIAPELLPAIMERMTGREGAVSMTRVEFVSFCELAAAAAAEEDEAAPDHHDA